MDLKKLKKDELIQIILRKDDVEKGLRADIKGMQESLLKKNEEIDRLAEDKSEQGEEMNKIETECRHMACDIYTLHNIIKRLRRRNYIWFTTGLLAILGLVVSLIF